MMRLFRLPFHSLAAACIALAALSSAPAFSKDLGVRGAAWPVAEPDLLAEIEGRLLAMDRSGELARAEREARVSARFRMEEPEAVAGITPAKEPRTRLFDPAITLRRDIRFADGTLSAAAGTQIDPLHHVSLIRDILFIDGTREAEVEWALGHGRPSKIVLLAGRPLDLARVHGRPFFFDQGGRLAHRFGLRATPTLVERDGARLRITEIPLEDRDERKSRRETGR